MASADQVFDVAIIGGGINGSGVARDAAGRGLSVVLLEQGDLGGATSSASTKLIHGGLRYLEHYAFRLVHEALAEREVLLRAAPHLIRPMRFVLPHHPGLRPWWMVRTGLFLYDHLGGRKILPGTRVLDLRRDPAGAPLQPRFARAFEYSDCCTDDSRLVVLNARDAAARGASIRTRTRCTRASVASGFWVLALDNGTELRARVLVNAAGPWVSEILADVVGQPAPARIRMVKGSHIVVPRLFTHDRSYIFQNADGRICFAIPYESDFTLLGTTDEDYQGDPAEVAATEADERYLCEAVSDYFVTPVAPGSAVWRYAGVRPLLDDGASKAQDATRDYVLRLQQHEGAPLLSVFGGKLTTYRRLAESALRHLAPHFPGLRPAWTANAPLPGGDFPWDGLDALRRDLAAHYGFLPDATRNRLLRAYGTLAFDLLGETRGLSDLGQCFGADLYQREVEYLCRTEWVRTADDILWRRGKLGLRLSAAEAEELQRFVAELPALPA